MLRNEDSPQPLMLNLNAPGELAGETLKLAKRVPRYAQYLLDLAKEDYFLSYELRPSILTSACVLAARVCNKVEPAWSPCLIAMTGYQRSELEGTLERLKL